MATPLYPLIERLVEEEWVKLERDQITPWTFMTAGSRLRMKDFYGKEIIYEGVDFDGSPSDVFWGRHIEPFLEDLPVESSMKHCGCPQTKRRP